MIEGMMRLMDSPADFTGPVNIGNEGEFTIRELAEKVISIVGGRSTIEFQPLPQDDPRQRKPDLSLVRRTLNWSPKVGLDDGLRETVRYFQQALSHEFA